jgi:hypothetical protein
MSRHCVAIAFLAATGLLTSSTARAQHHHHHHHDHYTPGYHIDHHDHVIRDSHGHIIGRYHHDVVHSDSTYILPYTEHDHGTYYFHDGGYYYHPESSSIEAHSMQPVQVEFGGFAHVHELAARLETLSNEFCLDLHYNYSHNYGYPETYAEAYEILQIAKYIHEAEHAEDHQAIAERLGGLDALFHHVQDDVRQWSRHHRRQIGRLGIVSKMDMIESTIHHLMNDVGVAPTGADGEQAPPPDGIGNEQAPPPPGTGGPGVLNSPPPGLPPQP